MVRKRKIRQRDSESTKRKLLDAVGAIMREQGFTGLKTNFIAKWVGKDKNLIRYHFQGLANLQKAYIKEKDYWPPFFKKFALTADSDAIEMEILFIELMKENLRFFYDNQEMQKIILWQISEGNTVLKSISEAREIDGAKLLDKTDRFFRNSDVNFRAIIALMLGGVYYMVLHANTNNSVVCGINVHIEKDRDEVLKTIEQVISWSWKQVAHHGLEETKTPKSIYEYELLETLASRFHKNFVEGTSELSLENELIAELKRIEEFLLQRLLDLTNETQIKMFLKINLFRLVQIADGFYLDKDLVHQESRLVADMILKIIAPVMDMVSGELQLPRVLWESECLSFNKDVQSLEDRFSNLQIDPVLIDLVLMPFYRFQEGSIKMKWHDYLYLNKYKYYLTQLLLDKNIKEYELLDAMIALNVNDGNVIVYFKTKIKETIVGQNFQELTEMLLNAKRRVSQLNFFMDLSLNPEKQSAVDELANWLDAELDYLKDEPLGWVENPLKIRTKLNAVQLAVWQKLQHDNGVYDEPNLDVLSEKVAGNFSSKGQDKLSSASIKSKLYAKEIAVLGSVEQLLVSMLESLRQIL